MRTLITALMLSAFIIPTAHAGHDAKWLKKDANGDGTVSRAESNAYNDKVFNEMDKNKDDKVTEAEAEAYVDKYGWSGKPGQNERVHATKDANEDTDKND
jgi:hypothetical protein